MSISGVKSKVWKFLAGYKVFDEASYSEKKKMERADLKQIGSLIEEEGPDVAWDELLGFPGAGVAEILQGIFDDVKRMRHRCMVRRYVTMISIVISQACFYFLGKSRG